MGNSSQKFCYVPAVGIYFNPWKNRKTGWKITSMFYTICCLEWNTKPFVSVICIERNHIDVVVKEQYLQRKSKTNLFATHVHAMEAIDVNLSLRALIPLIFAS